ncbi:putative ABC transporter permease protein YtlD [Weizmannia acidilactici]|uniref:ABC transporter permease protein YtlD n=1 Tax=Weizmannia acidilactici TaxID=2607726 RepID=A0A5J4JK60_9BACI|nr:ABC transporter permease [Weizmannia acidilactici]GER66501.1 putative ABC transporter permease protein YtlD [Weizmannia acidilactici]GER69354.1 putative ABC transporter permease protein YtlD [Weizmannia acidilactici]GER72319.1 putative ABC transporter permease protein YtlD [Weizmannia acidilactici]
MKTVKNVPLLHEDYLAAIRKEKRRVRFFQLLILIVFFCLWEIASRRHWIDPLIFSSPSKVWALFVGKIEDGSLYIHLGITVFETIMGFILGTLLGAVLAAILWWSPLLSKILDPYLVVFNAMPKVALGPILIVSMGPGFSSIISMGIIISVIVTTIVIYTAFRDVDPNYIKVLRSFGATRMQVFREAVLPASVPVMISTLKVNVGLAWVGVIVGEYLVSSQGLGYMIIYGFQVFNFTLVMLSMIMIAIVATIMYQLVDLLEKKLMKDR